MTIVEWLEDCLTEQHPNGSFVWNKRADLEALFKQAKEMEKQQIIDAWEDGQNSFSTRTPKQYYKETFKNK